MHRGMRKRPQSSNRNNMGLKQRKKRVCRWCKDKQSCRDLYIDFKDTKKLSRFLTEQGKTLFNKLTK